MFCDDDELPRAAAAAAKPQASPLWPPADNNDMSTWPQGSPWPASKALSAQQKVKEMEEEYKVLGEDQLRGKMTTFRGVLKQPSDSLMPNKSPFTYRENAWIQLEALRRVWVKRQESAAKWGEVCLRRPASQHAGQVADTQLPSLCCRRLTNCRHRRETEVVAAPERARCVTVPKAATVPVACRVFNSKPARSLPSQPGFQGTNPRVGHGVHIPAPRPQSRGASLAAAAVGKPGGKGGLNLVTTNNAARAPMPFGALSVEQATQQQQQGRSTQAVISHHFGTSRAALNAHLLPPMHA